MWLVVGGAGRVAPDVARVHLQHLCRLLHEVVAGDARGRAQQRLPGLVLVDDHVAGGEAAPAPITLCSDDLSWMLPVAGQSACCQSAERGQHTGMSRGDP